MIFGLDFARVLRTVLIANRGVRDRGAHHSRMSRKMGISPIAVYLRGRRALPCTVRMAGRRLPDRPGRPRPRATCASTAHSGRAARQAGTESHPPPAMVFLAENADFAQALSGCPALTFVGPPPQAMARPRPQDPRRAKLMQGGRACRSCRAPWPPLGHIRRGAARGPAEDWLSPWRSRPGCRRRGAKGLRMVAEPGQLESVFSPGNEREPAPPFGKRRGLSGARESTARATSKCKSWPDQFGQCVWLGEAGIARSSGAIRKCSKSRRRPAVSQGTARTHGRGSAVRARARRGATPMRATVEVPAGAGTATSTSSKSMPALQVEHAVTEGKSPAWIWCARQLRVAAGEAARLRPGGDSTRAGYARRVPHLRRGCRGPDFMPSTGRLKRLSAPPPDPAWRVDSGPVEEGAENRPCTTIRLIAKLIVQRRRSAGVGLDRIGGGALHEFPGARGEHQHSAASLAGGPSGRPRRAGSTPAGLERELVARHTPG